MRAPPAVRSALLALVLLGAGSACGTPAAAAGVHPVLTESAAKRDLLALSDALEALVADGKDTPEDRAFAYRTAQESRDDGSASYAFARAAVTGRFVQAHGLTKGPLAAEVERYARQSRALDPAFRRNAATRMLGTLYVIVPAGLLKHGNSEDGLALLEGLVKAHPEMLENHLRLAEAYLALSDAPPAYPHLCLCQAKRDSLRKDEQRLLDQLVHDAGTGLRCEGEAAAPPGAPSPAAAPPAAAP